MTDIPIHKAIPQTDCGIFAKEVSPFSPKPPVDYAHRDDYYVFGVVKSGTCRVVIDFKEWNLQGGDILCTHPNQVHRVVDIGDAKAYLLFVDGVFIDASVKQILAEYAPSPIPLKINDTRHSELDMLFSMILRRVENRENSESKLILQNLSCAVVGIITDAMRTVLLRHPENRRHIEIMLAFKELISKEERVNRNISYYAGTLHISSVYLNEVVKNITGVSVSRFIRSELVLRAKRMLIYTSLNRSEIAARLGVDDYAYFTRLFTEEAGMNPTLYRKKHLE